MVIVLRRWFIGNQKHRERKKERKTKKIKSKEVKMEKYK
jgi:hypothetical protein